MKALLLLAVLAVSAACSSGSPKPAAPPPVSKPTPVPAAPAAASPAAPAPAAAPTPSLMARTDPNVVEETETYVITRLPKAEYIRVDDRHVKHPLLGFSVEFFKEDDAYYYVIRQKRLPEEEALRQQSTTGKPVDPRKPKQESAPPAVPLTDFEDLLPPRVSGRLKLEAVSETGLPQGGMWRASFVVADMNGDRLLDIVAPSPRIGNGSPNIWLGDGKGRFAEWPLTFFSEDGKSAKLTISYGGVAAGDIDGDGNMDFACATHGAGVVALFGDGNGAFRIVRKGLPTQDFSAQAVVLLDADGDGKLDIVASRDREKERKEGEQVETAQVRVYLYRGAEGWKFKEEGLVGGFYSNSLSAWDYDADGRKDVLTGSHYVGALTLLWKNMGDGTFSPMPFNAIEIYAYHFATAPGTFGKDRAPAFADAFLMNTNEPVNARATGITIYAFENGRWTRNRVWREKNGKTQQYALAMGDLDGDGLDDVLFADTVQNRLRILFQQANGGFLEMAEKEEPALDSPGQCIRLADLDGDGRLDVVVSKTVTSMNPNAKGGWSVYMNRK